MHDFVVVVVNIVKMQTTHFYPVYSVVEKQTVNNTIMYTGFTGFEKRAGKLEHLV